MKLYMLACLLAIASSAAASESATKPTKKAAPKVDPVPLSTAKAAVAAPGVLSDKAASPA